MVYVIAQIVYIIERNGQYIAQITYKKVMKANIYKKERGEREEN